MKYLSRSLPFAILMAVGILLGGCQRADTGQVPSPSGEQIVVEVTRVVEKVVTREVPKESSEPPSSEPSGEIPFAALWISSGHANTESRAFNNWNAADPPVVPESCAKCHSTYGYLDFLGADGSTPGVVNKAADIGSVITCIACHNDQTVAMDSVMFPSGVELAGLGADARCAQCHQGRASGVQIEAAIEAVGEGDLDTVAETLAFINIHYQPAAAIQAGALAMAGYQYENRAYDLRFAHEGLNSCISCHDPHSLRVDPATCSSCHANVEAVEDLRSIRMAGSLVDYDGDGDITKGIYYEIQGLQTLLYQTIQGYAADVAGTHIVYASSHPYFFIDTNQDGKADADEVNRDNRYNAWTPRLLRAAHNYQTVKKDPGAYAHNGKYAIQLLYDSIKDLNQALDTPIDLSNARRDDPGHFAGFKRAFRNWDGQGAVPSTCSKCHSGSGLPFFLQEGVNISQPPSNGLECSTCHDSLTEFTRYEVASVVFPSGAAIDSGSFDTNLCLSCHQGRSSTVAVNRLVDRLEDDAVAEQLRFQNVHYSPAGATLFGTEAKGAYEYAGQTYAGRNMHVPAYSNCIDCHGTHTLDVEVANCAGCHGGVTTREDLSTIRTSSIDYDGDGDIGKGIAEEIKALHGSLYEAIQLYARDVANQPIAYAKQHPYFFVDTNGNGVVDPDEAVAANQYNAWTPRLLRAAYNYQFVAKDPGAYAHNSAYVLQILYDSLQDLGTIVPLDIAQLERPE
jgi:hypothetical protein